MKNFKKLMALVIAAVMVVGSFNVFAAPGDAKTRTISISGLEEGDKVNFYKVLNWADTTQEAKENGAVQGWYWAAPFATAFAGNNANGQNEKLYDAINAQNQLYLTDALAGDIARALNGTNTTPVNGATPVAESSGTATYTINTTEGNTDFDGLYMAVIIPADQDTVYNPVFVHLDSSTDENSIAPSSNPSYMNNGAAKKSVVTLEKEAHNAADYTTPADDGDTTKPGDVLDFKVSTTIPGYGDMFTSPVFKITDQMNKLSLKTDTVKVFLKDGTEIATSNYTPTLAATGYTIDFKAAYLKGLKVPTDIYVQYQAEVLPGANTNVIKEKNTVTLEFSHDPTTESDQKPGGDKEYKKDITNHYTFSIDANNLVGPYSDRIGESGSEIIKVGVDKDGKPITEEKTWSNVNENNYAAGPLAGAEFELLDKNKQSFSPKKTATSDASGRLNFTGLDAGEYWLQETKAPAGYVKNSDPVKITIAATMEERTITEYTTDGVTWISDTAYNALSNEAKAPYQSFTYKTDELKSYTVTYNNQASTYTFDHEHEGTNDEIKWKISTSDEIPQSIPNVKGVELPSTGGMGTTLFYAIGAILVLGAGILLVSKRRMSAN